MNPEPYTFDLVRIFVGDAPPLIYVEILLRTLVMYVYTFMLVRALGKRESGTLSPFELVIVISLGSAVGDPMFYPDVPLFHGFTVITGIVILQRVLENLTNRFPSLERRVEGKTRVLIKEGVIHLENMHHERLSYLELFSALRSKEITHLGQVYRAYFEPSGDISVMQVEPERVRPGLGILPKDDPDAPSVYQKGITFPKALVGACCTCGTVKEFSEGQVVPACEVCAGEEWCPAVIPTQSKTPQ
jgi:uncharacterized membrane protein YcaP (DUF421 family)